MTTVRVSHVSKSYGTTLAVSDVSFELRAGEIVGFLGPNGAGKSTLLKMMVHLAACPPRDRIKVDGFDVVRPGRSR